MIRPGILIATGVCGLLAIGLGVKRFSGSNDDAPRAPKPAAFAKTTATERGWIARPDPAAPGGGVASDSGRVPSSIGSGRDVNNPDVRGDLPSERSGAKGGGATVIGTDSPSRGIGAGSFRPDLAQAGGERLQVNSAVPAAAVPFEGALPVAPEARREELARRAVAQGLNGATDKANTSAAPADDNKPVLSLPLTNKSAAADDPNTAVFHQGVEFDSEGAVFSTDSQFIVPNGGNIQGEGGTISFWMQPQWGGGDEGDASLVQLRDSDQWDNRLQIFKNGRYLRFLFTPDTGKESNVAAVVDAWQPNEWHQVTATWGDSVQSFYVDGHLVGQQTYTGQLDVRTGTPLYIGSDLPRGGPSAGGAISNFQVYRTPLGPDAVSNLASSRR